MSLVDVRSVKKVFGDFVALNDLSLSLDEGQQYAILGASGSGKSTLLYLIGGLDKADGGVITVDGKQLNKLSDELLARYRNEYVGFVFQFHFLLPSMTCLKNILLPAEIGGHQIKKVKKRALDIAEHLGVTHCLHKFPFQLSGGEQQRINIIRALSLKPKLLLCDEPTGNLDSDNSNKVTHLLKDLAHEFKSTLAVVTHDASVAKAFDNQFVMKDGELIDSKSKDVAPPLPPLNG
jgi:lipoprotein-releasing system ATP-binding protein